MIELNPSVVAIWFLGGGAPRDWMACLSRLPDDRLKLTYRIRYYDSQDPGNDAFSGKDKKKWSGWVTKTPVLASEFEEHITNVRAAAVSLADAGFQPPGYKLYEVVNNGDFEAFVKKFLEMPFIHARTPTGDEAKDFQERLSKGGFHVE